MYLSGAPHRWPSEPLPNIDTLLLRQHCHEAFHAVPLCSFSPKEREIVCNFVSKLQGTCSSTSNCTPEQWSNSIWNQINDGFGEKIQRSGFECKLWWELNANPKRRFSAWTKEEDFTLKALAEGQVDPLIVNNWIEVAKQMPFPGRPPVHCLIRYQTKLNEYMVNRQFTPEEDEMLQEAVQVFGERWAVIADLMDGRVADQLRTRWTRSIAPGIRAGKFSTEEDRRLVLAIYSHYCMENDLDDTSNGFDADKIEWHEIVPHIPGRTAISLRERFVNSLNPQVNMKKFTKEEDDTLLQLVHEADLLNEHGVWSRIAAQLDNRKDNQVWRRWKALAPIEYEQFLKRKRQNQSLPEIFSRPTKRRRGKLKHNRVIFFDAEQKEQEDEVQDQEEEEEI
jgi:predicted CopG family antitoxin